MPTKLYFSISALVIILLFIPSLKADDLIVMNGLAETLTRVDLTTGAISNNFVVVGLIPNHILCRNNKAYVVNSGSNDLYIVDLKNNVVEEIIDLGSNRNPWAMSFIDDTTILVTNFITSSLARVDVKNMDVLGEWALATRPQGLISIGERTYIAISGFNPADTSYGPGKVAVWDNSGDSLIAYIAVGTNPQDLDIGPDGRLFVACTGDYEGLPGMLYIIDTLQMQSVDSFVTSTSYFPPNDVVVTSNGIGFLAAGGWVSRGEVYTFNAIDGVMLHGQSNPLQTDLGVIAVMSASDSSIYSMNFGADNITEMDSAGHILRKFYVGNGPQCAAINRFIPEYLCGDANSDGSVNVSDAVRIINFVFIGGNPPDPLESGEANCDGSVNVSDAVKIINFVFIGGFAPCDSNGDGIPDC